MKPIVTYRHGIQFEKTAILMLCLFGLFAGGLSLQAQTGDMQAEADRILQDVRAAVAENPPPPITEQRLKKLISDLSENEAFDRINAIVELVKVAEQARPALPMMKSALAREYGMLGEPKIAALLIRAIDIIENPQKSVQPPVLRASDIQAVSEQLVLLSVLLRGNGVGEEEKLAALTQMRSMRVLAEPLQPLLVDLQQKPKVTDKFRQAAQETLRRLETDLWFLPSDQKGPVVGDWKSVPDGKTALQARLTWLVGMLAERLADPQPPTQMKAIRLLLTLEAAGAGALPGLDQLTESPAASTTLRQAAALAARKIRQAQQDTDAARAAATKPPEPDK